MNRKQLRAGNQLEEEREGVCAELAKWQHDLTRFSAMCYARMNNGSFVGFSHLHSKVPERVFNNFRVAAIEHLQARLKEIDAEFEGL